MTDPTTAPDPMIAARDAATDAVVKSPHRRRVIVAGPGTRNALRLTYLRSMPSRQASRQVIVAILHVGRIYKAARLLASSDGSFSILVPYHPARHGALFKIAAPNVLEPTGGGWSKTQQGHRTTRLVKLSYHMSGFVQFSSGERAQIRSGRKSPEEFLETKGIGIQSQPLTDPIQTGASLSASLFCIEEHAELEQREKQRIMLFRKGDLCHNNRSGQHDEHFYSVEVFVFPRNRRKDAEFVAGQWVLRSGHESGNPNLPTEFRIFDLPTAFAFLGIVVYQHHDGPNRGHRYKYSLTGPRDLGSRLWLSGSFYTAEQAAAEPSDPEEEWPSLDEPPPPA